MTRWIMPLVGLAVFVAALLALMVRAGQTSYQVLDDAEHNHNPDDDHVHDDDVDDDHDDDHDDDRAALPGLGGPHHGRWAVGGHRRGRTDLPWVAHP